MIRGESNILHHLSYAVVIAIVIHFFCIQIAVAENQVITLIPDNTTQSVGSEFNIAVNYSVTDNNNDLLGIGVRIHYNSSKIEYLSYQDAQKLSGPPVKKDDSSNKDHDSNTDKYINIAGADVNGWPNTSLPLTLVYLKFKIQDNFTEGETTVNVSNYESDKKYSFHYETATIEIMNSQEIPLHQGWNLFSFSVNKVYYIENTTLPDGIGFPDSTPEPVSKFEVVLESLGEDYVIIQDISGNAHYRGFSFGTLKCLAVGQGYWIYMLSDNILKLSGPIVDPASSITLGTGWNIIGCWLEQSTNNVAEIFDRYTENVLIVINENNQMFVPGPNGPILDNIDSLGPGQAYWIYVQNNTIENFHY